MDVSATMRNLRLSTTSANAPAGKAKMRTGTLLATCTKDTISGSVVSVVINQPAAALYIQPPMFDTTVATHTSANMRCRKGAHADTVAAECVTADD
jgi:cytochrome c oxidase assembly factor CtaG